MSQSSVVSAGSKSEIDVDELLAIAVRGLHRMYDPNTGIFCDRLVREAGDWKRIGISRRYSLMSYLGLERAENAGIRTGFAPADLTRRIASELGWLDNLGDLGCLLWAVAEILPAELRSLWSRIEPQSAIDRYIDGKTGSTMELAWFLTGLAKSKQSDQLEGLDDVIERTLQQLMGNRGQSGLFGHLSRKAGLRGATRGHIGSFADQVYPVIALSCLFEVSRREPVLEAALTATRKVCSLQGPLGQWWWHYNSESGTVVSTYPVYSVHQHAMGPMMLFAAMEASEEDFRSHIHCGLQWIAKNEFGRDMREETAPLVWRSIAQPAAAKWMTRAKLTVSSSAAVTENAANLSLVRECRPYELGWLLYAFAQPGNRHH